ncbi:AzlC family ABC transporter permease [Oceanicella actignis]|uniref:Predicted branched-chain amino acid permease (Azaleucine resistance) n=1 Tax=Oceanicella actignis TaxID=1189325 RepID=A0A1M7TRS4_9RHOB|nr:AzlC family ABC transporter permease [Oceanicella actignis]TYO85434.1 putative branched-subunit amino acid permease [Oceanicella actignis]SET77528.1 Predicted branched-chain amino acid permease (azaleucine resistance) [Oceanicella actignis]SHN73454.1 Predicted branched-chain amino acid permease (azaleucine resistance) [Oceanicella actignis]
MRTRGAFVEGVAAGAPFLLVILPFGALFGVVATEAGLDLMQTFALTSLVIAGASQFALVQMLSDGAPAALAVLTALAVNLRMAMYSASLTPHLGKAPLWVRALAAYFLVDQAYAAAIARYSRRPDEPLPRKIAFYFGVLLPVVPVWFLGTLAGATLGARIPPEYALDFAVPITFVAIVAPMLRSLPNLAAAFVASAAALALAWAPYGSGLLLASAAGMGAGAAVELALERRRPAPEAQDERRNAA